METVRLTDINDSPFRPIISCEYIDSSNCFVINADLVNPKFVLVVMFVMEGLLCRSGHI